MLGQPGKCGRGLSGCRRERERAEKAQHEHSFFAELSWRDSRNFSNRYKIATAPVWPQPPGMRRPRPRARASRTVANHVRDYSSSRKHHKLLLYPVHASIELITRPFDGIRAEVRCNGKIPDSVCNRRRELKPLGNRRVLKQ
jgi:hypothetical protein